MAHAPAPTAADLIQGSRARVLFLLLACCQGLASGKPGMGHRSSPTAREDIMPAIEKIGAYLWLLGLYDVEPDVEVAEELRAEGLLARELSYDLDDGLDDASDPDAWLARQDELPPEIWEVDARQGCEAGVDAESE